MMRLRGPWIATAASVAVLLGGWVTLSWGGVVSDLFLPGPDELWDAIVDLVQEGYKNRPLWVHVADSLVDGGESACPGQVRDESGRDVLVEADTVAVQGEG